MASCKGIILSVTILVAVMAVGSIKLAELVDGATARCSAQVLTSQGLPGGR